MPIVYLTTTGYHATLSGRRIVVKASAYGPNADTAVRFIHLHDVEGVVVDRECSITTDTLRALMELKIPVAFLNWRGEVSGTLQVPVPNPTARIAQWQKLADRRWALAIAALIVEAKILNSRRILQRMQANAAERDARQAIARLKDLARACPEAPQLDRLRGLEGMAAAVYFEAFGSFFPDSAPFEHRSRRPPLNAANALLSYGYAVLTGECIQTIFAAGLEPALGALHEQDRNRPSLALDLIEPFRAPLIDAMTLDLLSHGTLNAASDFEPHDGGVYLSVSAKRRFFTAYERRMERVFTHPSRDERTTLRAELQRQVALYKSNLLGDRLFEPFFVSGS